MHPHAPLCKIALFQGLRAFLEQKPSCCGKQKLNLDTAFLCLSVLTGKLLMTRDHPGTLLKNLWGVPLIVKEDNLALQGEELQKQILNHT